MTTVAKRPYDLIIQPNKITNARYEFSKVQKDIMIHIMGALQDRMTSNQQTLFGEVTVMIELKDLDENRNYQRIRDEAAQMKKKDIEYETKTENGKETEILTSLISGISYEKGSRMIGFDIPSKAVPVLCYIGDGYTKFRQLVSLSLRSAYSKRIYELCCRWEDREGFRMPMKEFRATLAIPESYRNSNIKQRVLDPCKDELKKDADVYFEYDLEKSKGSKKYDQIVFKVITKKDHKLQSKEEKTELNKKMYSGVYGFLSSFFPDRAWVVADHLNLNDKLEEAYDRLSRLDDEYCKGSKKKADVIRLVRHIAKEDWGIAV